MTAIRERRRTAVETYESTHALGNQNKNAVRQSAMMGIGNDENETREYDLF